MTAEILERRPRVVVLRVIASELDRDVPCIPVHGGYQGIGRPSR